MRRWAAVTALLTIPYGLAFLVHERPPTSGHALAGLVILAAGIFVLGSIGAFSNQRSKRNATWLLACQIVLTACAVGALLLQQLPFTTATFLALLAFVIPVLGSVRHYRPAAWTPKPVTNRDLVVDLCVEAILIGGILALMIWSRRFPIGYVISVIVGFYAMTMQLRLLMLARRLDRLHGELSQSPSASINNQNQPLAG